MERKMGAVMSKFRVGLEFSEVGYAWAKENPNAFFSAIVARSDAEYHYLKENGVTLRYFEFEVETKRQ